ncbi:ATP-dependent DNA ligase [Streptomyces fagopyri]|nr:ATP-dependent DNA ligase [Streptomyces fagopyri]
MLTSPTPLPRLTPGWTGEPKWDGFRALLHTDAGQVVLRSRRGTEMSPAFPDIAAAAVQLPDATALDGELVVWEDDRLAFERLQNRLQRRGAAAAQAAQDWPAHFVAFDLLRLSGTDTTAWPYQRRRAALESVFTSWGLTAPWTLSPSTTNPDSIREWLTWTTVGIEGVVFNRLNEPYRPAARSCRKYEVRETTEAIAGAITSQLSTRTTLLLGRYNNHKQLQYIGRTTTLPHTAGSAVAGLLTAAPAGHPWTGWSFSAGWGSRETLDVTMVEPELVVEVSADVARDPVGRWRHPARWHRARTDLTPNDIPRSATSP